MENCAKLLVRTHTSVRKLVMITATSKLPVARERPSFLSSLLCFDTCELVHGMSPDNPALCLEQLARAHARGRPACPLGPQRASLAMACSEGACSASSCLVSAVVRVGTEQCAVGELEPTDATKDSRWVVSTELPCPAFTAFRVVVLLCGVLLRPAQLLPPPPPRTADHTRIQGRRLGPIDLRPLRAPGSCCGATNRLSLAITLPPGGTDT